MDLRFSPESLSAPISKLTAGTLVGMIDEMSQIGNCLVWNTDSHPPIYNGEIEMIQNYHYLDPVTLEDLEITVSTQHYTHSTAIEPDPYEVMIWIDNLDTDIEYWLCFNTESDNNFSSDEPCTEGKGYEIISLLEKCELLDDLTPEDMVEPSDDHALQYRKRYT